MKFIFNWLIGLFILTLIIACNSLLEEIPNKKIATPSTLKALVAMLDDEFALNGSSNGLGELSSDDYYLSEQDYNAISLNQRNLYTWQNDIGAEDSYMVMYRKINIANIVLESLSNINNGLPQEKEYVRGAALFIRANTLLALSTIYTKMYDDNDLGLIIRESSDFNIPSKRSNLKLTYDYIERDLLEALNLLPLQSAHVYRLNKLAALALLSRFYLIKGNYNESERYADSVLLRRSDLLDYNTLNQDLRYPMPPFNKEIIYQTYGATGFSFSARAKIDTNLYDLYADNDLRKKLFFFNNADGSKRFKGSYVGGEQRFSGLALDEIYLNKAECLARRGETNSSMEFLNRLLSKRYSNDFRGKYANDANDALDFILEERRKQLLMRDIRWFDIKRLNREERYKKVLVRKIAGKLWELKPASNKYALPLPESVIEMTGVPQNPL